MKYAILLFAFLPACSADAFTSSDPLLTTSDAASPDDAALLTMLDSGTPRDSAKQPENDGSPSPDSAPPAPDAASPCSGTYQLPASGGSSKFPSASCQGSTPWGCIYPSGNSWLSQCMATPSCGGAPSAAIVECSSQQDCVSGGYVEHCYYNDTNAALGNAKTCGLTLKYSGDGAFMGTSCANASANNPLICLSDSDCSSGTHCYPVTIPGTQPVKFMVCQ
jgi:hypothetical protein